MSGHAASPPFGTPGVTPELREATREMTGYSTAGGGVA
jgi:hypothetical protein